MEDSKASWYPWNYTNILYRNSSCCVRTRKGFTVMFDMLSARC